MLRRLFEWFWPPAPPLPCAPCDNHQEVVPACAGCGKHTHNLEVLHGCRPHMPRYCRECRWDAWSDHHTSGSGY